MEILKIIADNPALSKALRDLLEKQFTLDDLSIQTSDEALGQQVRASIVGRRGVEEAFREIGKYKTQPDSPERKNLAR